MTQRTPEAIEAPHDECVPFAEVIKDTLKLGTIDQGAASGIGEDAITAGCMESIELQRYILLIGGNPRVSEQRHEPIVS